MPRHPKRFTEDGVEIKYCKKCDQWKPKTLEFFKFREDRQCWDSPCRECNREYMRIYAVEHPPSTETAWGYAIKSNYGITVDEYFELLNLQNGRCAVCKKLPDANKKLSVDHCHTTGRVRGLLCYKCNTAAGMLGDDPELAAILALYLKGDDSL